VRALEAAGAQDGRAAPPGIASADLLTAEHTAAGAYLAALPGLRGGDARSLATGLHAASAQRASVLLAAAGRDPLPDAFAGSLA
jgi:crotonobetainyl-CoA:carnitine CoA-transferase CaiB-like acyl-CoA transferase